MDPRTTAFRCLYLEAGGDGGELVVGGLRVSYQIVPAGEHLPGEVEAIVVHSPRLVGITGHPVTNAFHLDLEQNLSLFRLSVSSKYLFLT